MATKPITPTEVRALQDNSQEVERCVNELNQVLKAYRDHSGQGMPVSADRLGRGSSTRDRVEQLFRQAGWTVTYQSDQRDGDFYWFRAPRTR